VNVNCYITYGERPGIRSHADPHDVLAAQVHGAKRWLGYGPAQPGLADETPDSATRPVVWEDTPSIGSVLYLPAGEIHAALPVERPSVHLTFGMKPKEAGPA